MKTTRIVTKAGLGAHHKAGRRTSRCLGARNSPLLPARIEPNRIQWPTGQQIQDVSKRLARISREGIRCELGGDYFNSGNLAYQLQEIIRATAELFNKSRRLRN